MISNADISLDRVFITGATGFIGHHVLAELLSRGVYCAALLRPDMRTNKNRLKTLLKALGVDLDYHARDGRLLLLEGDLNGVMPRAVGADIQSVLHIAACTDFEGKPNGDPMRTNVQGTRRLLDWAAQRDIKCIHLVSSAYRCGIVNTEVAECVDIARPIFNNDYEHSKWQAERDVLGWSQTHDVILTVYRPSIVVGHSMTSRTTSFGGFYVMARATQVLAQSFGDDVQGRRTTGVRVVGRASASQDLVPVDYVASMIATATTDSRYHGRVYHLTHPKPPSNATIKAAVDTYFDVDGSDFIDPDHMDDSELTSTERLFYDASQPVCAYLTHTPVFNRDNTHVLEAQAGVCCPAYTPQRLQDLIRYAESVRWGRKRKPAGIDQAGHLTCHDDKLPVYFERYLPARVAESEVARRTAMTVTVRFVIEDAPECAWRCRFVSGRLVHSQRATTHPEPGPVDDFVYITSRQVFWEATAGQADPQRVFLENRVRVTGDVETALKMAMVLYQFNREFPCTPESLDKWQTEEISAGDASLLREVVA